MSMRFITSAMTKERFKAIIDAYGASEAHWPEAERAAAISFAKAHPSLVAPWIEAARDMDSWLDEGKLAPLNLEGTRRIHNRTLDLIRAQDGANIVRLSLETRRSRKLPWLWTGIGLAACIAGASIGVKLSLVGMGNARAQSVLVQTFLVDPEN